MEMFPYPSGSALHMGHFFNFAPADTHARFKKMCGYDVFHPMGFDAFGLPAENHALKTDTHPHDNTLVNMEKFRAQLDELGGMYDWDYTLTSCFPEYYKWTQWLFLELFNAGLAYQKESQVNWCNSCATVIANEQVVSGECERCSTSIIKKPMKQWFFKITEFAEELLEGLDRIDWPERTKSAQRNWIGKSEGAEVTFTGMEGPDITVFTTRIDTLGGATFIALAPEHPLIKDDPSPSVRKYIAKSLEKTELERQENKEKTGVKTDWLVVQNPMTGEQIPIFVADYVLMGYGTGAVMGVPAHDECDFEFAKKYNLEIRKVIKTDEDKDCITEDGILINSGKYDGLASAQAREKMTSDLGKSRITYRLRDWSVSRQRYWGAPIPIIHCDKCGAIPAEIPVILPYLKDFKPKGAPPLANDKEFLNATCPKCKGDAHRDVETLDTFVCSSWYFLRYPYANRDDVPFEKSVQPVDVYVGGAEHSVMHLLYARFVVKALYKMGHIGFDEPFKRMIHQGMILAPDGQKMAKSKGNTVSPDGYIKEFGSDVVRLYMLFGFNYVDGGPWSDGALRSTAKFIDRVKRVFDNKSDTKPSPEIEHIRATTIKAVREDLDSFSFNTAVARCMEFVNALMAEKQVPAEAVIDLIKLLAPMIPVTAEKLLPGVHDMPFPVANEKFLTKAEAEIVVQVNSKITDRITIPTNATQEQVEKLAGVTGAQKVIYIAGKLINFLVWPLPPIVGKSKEKSEGRPSEK